MNPETLIMAVIAAAASGVQTTDVQTEEAVSALVAIIGLEKVRHASEQLLNIKTLQFWGVDPEEMSQLWETDD